MAPRLAGTWSSEAYSAVRAARTSATAASLASSGISGPFSGMSHAQNRTSSLMGGSEPKRSSQASDRSNLRRMVPSAATSAPSRRSQPVRAANSPSESTYIGVASCRLRAKSAASSSDVPSGRITTTGNASSAPPLISRRRFRVAALARRSFRSVSIRVISARPCTRSESRASLPWGSRNTAVRSSFSPSGTGASSNSAAFGAWVTTSNFLPSPFFSWAACWSPWKA